ncbi:hypothetical protein MRX96_001595 [Rhipicephalus microplus]
MPDIHVETFTERDIALVSVSDSNVTKHSVSEDATVTSKSVSLKCTKCHSQLGLEICNVSTAGTADHTGTVGVFPVAQARPGECEQPQGFPIASQYAVPPRSPGMQISDVVPDAQLQPATTTPSIPHHTEAAGYPTIRYCTAATAGYALPISDTSTKGSANV